MADTEIQNMRKRLALFDKLAEKNGRLDKNDLSHSNWTVLCSDGLVRRIISSGESERLGIFVRYIVLREKGSGKSVFENELRDKSETGLLVSTHNLSDWNKMTELSRFLGSSDTGYDFDGSLYEVVYFH